MDGYVALRQNGDARDPAIGFEMMQMNMQQGRAGGIDTATQRRLDMVDVVEPFGFIKIDNQMGSGATNAVADNEMIVALLAIGRSVRPAGSRRDDVPRAGATHDDGVLEADANI